MNNEEPPVKKKRKSRWATDDEVIPLATQAQMPPVPIGPVGIVVPKGLGGVNVVVPPIASSVPTVNVPGKRFHLSRTVSTHKTKYLQSLVICSVFIRV